MSTDESPPSASRFAGLRFQITIVHMVYALPERIWEDDAYANEYPIMVEHSMCDLCHVPDKSGPTTHHVICNQLARKGVYADDVCAGATDGGGENMGQHEGIHAQFTQSNNSYVRRRCMSHISWRTCDAALQIMTPESWDLSTYLRDGITWGRLLAIATQPRNIGGLALMNAHSAAYLAFASPAPPSVLESRPETNFIFLQWLRPRQQILSKLIPHDLAQRNLRNQSALNASATIQNAKNMIYRMVDLVMLHKGLSLFHANKANHHVVAKHSYDQLVENLSDIITDLRVNDYVLKALDMHASDFMPHELNVSWVTFVVRQSGVGASECEDLLPDLLEYQQKIAMRMVGHLRLTWENINTPELLSGSILSKDAQTARTCARRFHDHLKRVQANELKPYERCWVDDTELMRQLDEFALQEPPCVVWRGRARWSYLFKFLAARFLGAGDTVLDCESMHARWKWMSETRNGIRFRLLNAVLKLSLHLEHYGDFPDDGMIYEHCNEIDAAERLQYAEACANREIAPRMRSAYMWQSRYNLGPQYVELVKERQTTLSSGSTVEQAWGMYLRWLFKPGYAYQLSALSSTYFFVGANQSKPGRDARQESEALGRSLAVAFFEEEDNLAEGKLLKPIDDNGDTILHLQNKTIAELSLACGFHPAVSHNDTAREVELMHEAALLRHDVQMHTVVRHDENNWKLVLVDSCFIEDHYVDTVAIQDMTKMGLARQIQLKEGLDDLGRNSAWSMTKQALLNRLAN